MVFLRPWFVKLIVELLATSFGENTIGVAPILNSVIGRIFENSTQQITELSNKALKSQCGFYVFCTLNQVIIIRSYLFPFSSVEVRGDEGGKTFRHRGSIITENTRRFYIFWYISRVQSS